MRDVYPVQRFLEHENALDESGTIAVVVVLLANGPIDDLGVGRFGSGESDLEFFCQQRAISIVNQRQ